MAFDWGVFLDRLGGGIQQAGNSYFGMMMREKQMEQDAARDLEMFKQKSSISQDIWEQQTERNEAFQEHMVTVNTEAQKTYEDSKIERDASLSRFYGDPEIQRELEGYLTPQGGMAGIGGSIKGMVMQDLLKKVRRGEPFTEQDNQALSGLGFATQAKLGEMNFVNTTTEREFQMRKQSATMQQSMYEALTNMYTEQIDASKRQDPGKALTIINAATKMRQDIVSGEQYMYLKSKSDPTRKKKERITPGEESLLGAMEQNLQLTEMVIQSAMGNLQQQRTPSPGEMAPPPQQQIQQSPLQAPTQQPGSTDQLGGLLGPQRKTGAKEIFQGIRGELGGRSKMEKIAKSIGIPPGNVIHINDISGPEGEYSDKELKALQAAGKFIFFDGTIHKIVWRDGKWGLVPVVE